MLNYDDHICPRCLGGIPNNMMPGQYIGALSRVDNKTMICSECGNEEAMLALIHTDEWPIVLYDHPTTEAARARFHERIEFQWTRL